MVKPAEVLKDPVNKRNCSLSAKTVCYQPKPAVILIKKLQIYGWTVFLKEWKDFAV
jgi:hypothetical protein